MQEALSVKQHESIAHDTSADLVCISHLRWNFVFQRPQHLMVRWARDRRVFFVEEPVEASTLGAQVRTDPSGVIVVTPQVPKELDADQRLSAQRLVLDNVLRDHHCNQFILWYYTPMALLYTRHLKPVATVYDCMDELSGFLGCPPEMVLLERELMARTNVMFTGGHSLYERKRKLHNNVHAFPSSVDVPHFGKARLALATPSDQARIPRPRIGFHGVIDERMDLELIRQIAEAQPDWHIVLLGPVVKIDPDTLPRRANIHYLGSKAYDQLPAYLSGWDATILPFALNEATRYISPTKTPEYLAGGKPVVSTPIHDVVRPYGEQGLVSIAKDAAGFVKALQAGLAGADPAWLRKVDQYLSALSWGRTWRGMREHISEVVRVQLGTTKPVAY